MSTRDQVIEALGAGHKTTAELAEATGKTPEQVESLLEMLESKSVIARNGGGKWRLPEPGASLTGKQAEIFEAIRKTPRTTAELIEKFGAHAANILTILKREGLIANEKKGRPWSATGGASAPAEPKSRKPRREKAAATNGHTNGHAQVLVSSSGDPVLAALDAAIVEASVRLEKLQAAREALS